MRKIRERRQEPDSKTEDKHVLVPEKPAAELPTIVGNEDTSLLERHAQFLANQVAEAKLFLDRRQQLNTVSSRCPVADESMNY